MIGGDMITYRPDIQVLDATIRDGGLVNDFYFTDEFVKALYEANLKAGVDIIDRADSVIDMIRVATYINTMPAAIEMIEDAHAKGYETTCNIMAISKDQESEIDIALEMLGKSNVDGIYIVDSYGSLYPEQIQRLTQKYVAVGEKYGKKIGIHAHDNMKMAYANTVEAMRHGASMLDGTVSSMGRGAGNCAMELLLGFLRNPKYNLYHILKFIERYMVPLKEKGDAVWGYDVPYMLNQHPREAIDFIKQGKHEYADMYSYLLYRE